MAPYARLLMVLSLLLSGGPGYAQFGFWLNYKGRVKLFSFTGAPYEMVFYNPNDPMARLKTFHKKDEPFPSPPDAIDYPEYELPKFDFYGELRPAVEHLFVYDYPFYDCEGKEFKEIQEITKGVFEYSGVTGRKAKVDDSTDIGWLLPTDRPGCFYFTWLLDSNYRISRAFLGSNYDKFTESRIKTNDFSGQVTITDTQCFYTYYYNKKGKIDSVSAWIDNGERGRTHMYSYYCYNNYGSLSYLITTRHQVHQINNQWCAEKLALLFQSQDSFVNRSNDNNSPDLIYLAAYHYRNKQVSAIYQYEPQYIFTKDSVTYNSRGLPVCIDHILLDDGLDDTSDTRFIAYYDQYNRVKKTINFSVDHFDQIKTIPLSNLSELKVPVADKYTYTERRYSYDKKGRIIRRNEKTDYHQNINTFAYKKWRKG